MEAVPPLSQTLQRLHTLIQEQGLDQSVLLDPEKLAEQTALPEASVRALLHGGATLPADSVNDRVRSRIRTLAHAHIRRTGSRMSDLASRVSERLGVSEVWARLVCDGKKVPSVEFLHGLVRFFDVEGGEAFFTAPADEALNRVLLPIVDRLQSSEGGDPVLALMDRYGVRATDLRAHGSLTREQLERLLEGVLRSVVPPGGGRDQ
ncbi:hypothetical protein H0H10_14050 [Streptomyces sp. TRM S81-3]|uniref:Uncharacterized protein n=1 Tax=Streptomyces griseicoloratus TaxID=2752516 RepID=A0A926L4I5_9ACTN|nr:hypothetical protein [Streptomyces griseicoloratus]MBD0420261.1 hypothetical protein [Streptomyces griseicoloratus]